MVFIIGVTGPSGAGKSTLARALQEAVGMDRAAMIVQDDYYRDLGHLDVEERHRVNFDDPVSVEFELLAAHLARLRAGLKALCPVYDFSTHTRVVGGFNEIEPLSLVIVEGLLIGCSRGVRSQLDLFVYVEAPAEVRLARRKERDVKERGRTAKEVEGRWQKQVEPACECFIMPHKAKADLVVGGTASLEESVTALLDLLPPGCR